MTENIISIWAYESDADVLRAWRQLSPSEREEQDVYWRRAMQRRLDQMNGRGLTNMERIGHLEKWRETVSDHDIFEKGVAAGRNSITKSQLAVAGAGFAVLMGLLDLVIKFFA